MNSVKHIYLIFLESSLWWTARTAREGQLAFGCACQKQSDDLLEKPVRNKFQGQKNYGEEAAHLKQPKISFQFGSSPFWIWYPSKLPNLWNLVTCSFHLKAFSVLRIAVSSEDLRGEPFTALRPLFTLQMKRFFPIIETLIHICIIHLQTQATSAVITYLERKSMYSKRLSKSARWKPGMQFWRTESISSISCKSPSVVSWSIPFSDAKEIVMSPPLIASIGLVHWFMIISYLG